MRPPRRGSHDWGRSNDDDLVLAGAKEASVHAVIGPGSGGLPRTPGLLPCGNRIVGPDELLGSVPALLALTVPAYAQTPAPIAASDVTDRVRPRLSDGPGQCVGALPLSFLRAGRERGDPSPFARRTGPVADPQLLMPQGRTRLARCDQGRRSLLRTIQCGLPSAFRPGAMT
jgi:hypothetical protein